MNRQRAITVLGRRLMWLAVITHLAALLLGALLGVLVWMRWERPAPFVTLPGRPSPLAGPAEFSWARLPDYDFPIPPYARFLRGVTIVLDPGHVGQRDPGGGWKRGPTGLREAEVNLRVARFLREFLAAAGAEVTLTRDEDRSLDLPDSEDLLSRARVANDLQADAFISIHHNAAQRATANFTTVFYHASDEHPVANRVLARHLLTGLNDVLRLETHDACPIKEDRVMYPKAGFGVLRDTRVPAVLTEASFHTNPEEEARLRDPVYNRREAYGLFLGLARWAQAGLPRWQFQIPDTQARNNNEWLVKLDDGLSGRGAWGADRPHVVPETLIVRLGGQPAPYAFDPNTLLLRVRQPGRGLRGPLFIDFQNILGQTVLHPWGAIGE